MEISGAVTPLITCSLSHFTTYKILNQTFTKLTNAPFISLKTTPLKTRGV